MSLFGSLITGVSALSAQSQAISMIANNIANVNTVGYKRREAAFQSLVTSESRNARYTPGSVLARAVQKIDGQGPLQQTNATTDIAISGNGFFVVQRSPQGIQEKLFTRAGSFTEDSNGFLRNTAGFYLMGWRIDENGQLPPGRDDISSLSSVNVSLLGGLTKATSTASLAINLDAAESRATYPLAATNAPDFKRTLRVFDSLGQGQNLEMQFTHIFSPTSTGTSAVTNGVAPINGDTLLVGLGTPAVVAGDDFTVDVGGVTYTYPITATSTVQDLINKMNGDPALYQVATAELTGSQIHITARNNAEVVTFPAAPPNAATSLGMTVTTPPFPAIAVGGGLENPANTSGWWEVSFVNLDTNEVLSNSAINFNSDGSLNALPDANGLRDITLSNINWGNGSDLQTIAIAMGSMTQFAGEYNVTNAQQNGAELGLRTGVEIDRNGIVTARFSNGQTSALFQLPIATFTSPNNLSEQTGNAYIQTTESGDYNLRVGGSGGAGLVEGSAVEMSNVDIADEFTKMIVTQRSYSAGTKVIRTTDEMTEELLRLR